MNQDLAARIRRLYDSAWRNTERWNADLELAADLLREHLALDADCVAAMTSLGAILSDQGRHAEAIAVLRRAEALGSSDANTYYNLGAALMNTGEHGRTVAPSFFARSNSLQQDPATLQAYFDPHAH